MKAQTQKQSATEIPVPYISEKELKQLPIKSRYEFYILTEVVDGSPNSEPNTNQPRTDPETGHGLLSDVMQKRKVRQYIDVRKAGEVGFKIFVQRGAILNEDIKAAFDRTVSKDASKEDQINAAHAYLTLHNYDTRAFGQVTNTGKGDGQRGGQIQGPVAINFGRSVDPIIVCDHTITLMAVHSKEESERQTRNQAMGVKYTVPYAVYLTRGFVSPHHAEKTGFGEDDLALLWEAILNMYEGDHSASRGHMSVRKLYVFQHSSALGNAPAFSMFERVDIKRKDGVAVARKFSDYDLTVNVAGLKEKGIKMFEKVEGVELTAANP